MPLPLTTLLILVIDLGTDMIPAIAFAYEHPELDIMDRHPRNAKRDALVGRKLISYSYFQIGMIQQFGGLFIYYFVMNDYGIRPHSLFYINKTKGYFPNPTDVYDPSKPGYGNTNFLNPAYHDVLEWVNN